MAETTGVAKVSVTLPAETVELIQKLADANNTTAGLAIAESVKLNDLLTNAGRRKAKILLRYSDGRMEEIVRSRS